MFWNIKWCFFHFVFEILDLMFCLVAFLIVGLFLVEQCQFECITILLIFYLGFSFCFLKLNNSRRQALERCKGCFTSVKATLLHFFFLVNLLNQLSRKILEKQARYFTIVHFLNFISIFIFH